MLGCRLLPEWYFSAGTHVVKHRRVDMERMKHDLTQIPEPIHYKQPAIFVYDCRQTKIKGVKHQKKDPIVLLTHLGEPILDFATLRCGWKKFLQHIIQQMVGLDGEKTLKNIDGDHNP